MRLAGGSARERDCAMTVIDRNEIAAVLAIAERLVVQAVKDRELAAAMGLSRLAAMARDLLEEE